jgi:hypothetical protein
MYPIRSSVDGSFAGFKTSAHMCAHSFHVHMSQPGPRQNFLDCYITFEQLLGKGKEKNAGIVNPTAGHAGGMD